MRKVKFYFCNSITLILLPEDSVVRTSCSKRPNIPNTLHEAVRKQNHH